jgi:hypothetical protein
MCLGRRERREDIGMVERIKLISKYEILGVCIEFTWLRMKCNAWFWQDFKHFSSVRAWNVAICVCKKDCTIFRLDVLLDYITDIFTHNDCTVNVFS